MGRQKHNWTWKGEDIGPRQLAAALGYDTATTLYETAKIIDSERGEDIQHYLQERKKEHQKTMITFEGCKRSHREIALLSGITVATLTARLNRYGVDCCLTYYPGNIPTKLQVKRKGASKKHGKSISRGRVNSVWGALSGRVRSENLDKITGLGTWEMQHV